MGTSVNSMSRSELTCVWQKKMHSVSFLFTQIIINLHFLVTMFALSYREPKFTRTQKCGRGCRGYWGMHIWLFLCLLAFAIQLKWMTSPLLSPDPSHSFHIVSLTHGPLLTPFKNSTAYFLLEKLQNSSKCNKNKNLRISNRHQQQMRNLF